MHKATEFIIMCVYTLYNTLMNVTGHHGKHYLVSRQTLWFMANNPFAILLTIPGFKFLACGGIVLLPSTSAARARGMFFQYQWTYFIHGFFFKVMILIQSFILKYHKENIARVIYLDFFFCSSMQETMALSRLQSVFNRKKQICSLSSG